MSVSLNILGSAPQPAPEMRVTSFAPQLKLFHHPEQLAAFERDDFNSPPVNVELSATHACPASCSWCWFVAGNHPRHVKEELSPDVLSLLIRDLREMGVKALTWTGGGDPCVYSHINEAITSAHVAGLRQGMFTNGYVPIKHPELLDWIRLTVTDAFMIPKCATLYASRTRTGVNFNLCAENAEHLRPMVEQARAAGVHYFQVRPALVDGDQTQPAVEFPAWLKDYETPTFEIVVTPYKFAEHTKPHGYEFCHGSRLTPFIWHNGDVSVCAYHFGKEPFIFGNLNRQSFKEIWYGERRAQMLRDGVGVIPSCQKCCKLHEVNKALASMRGEYKLASDENFL